MKRKRIILSLLIGLGCTGLAQAQGPDTVFVENVIASPGDTVEVLVRVKNSFDVAGMTMPFIFTGQGVTLISGTPEPRAAVPTVFTLFTEFIQPVEQTALFGFIAFGGPMPTGDGDVLRLRFAIASDAPDQVITIDTVTLPPANVLVLNDPAASSIFPTFIMGSITVGIIGTVAGDMDCDFEVTVGDIIYLVNFIFKNGPEPCSLVLADADCNGQLAIADAIYLVNYLFRGGSSPRPPCGQDI